MERAMPLAKTGSTWRLERGATQRLRAGERGEWTDWENGGMAKAACSVVSGRRGEEASRKVELSAKKRADQTRQVMCTFAPIGQAPKAHLQTLETQGRIHH